MAVTGEGSGKLLLFGEHAAVYGYPALGLALPWKTRVTLDENTSLSTWALPELNGDESARLHALVSLMFDTFPLLRKDGYRLTIHSDVPRGMGFGSSAALCVALVKAVVTVLANRFLPEAWARELLRELGRLWALANKAERLFHGKPSGIDTGLALFGKMQGFSFSGTGDDLPQHTEMKTCPLTLIVGGVPRDGSTKAHVQAISERYRKKDQETKSAIAHLGALSAEAIQCFHQAGSGSNDQRELAEKIGNLADQAETSFRQLGLGNGLVDDLLSCGRQAGATGGKMSGAGGGGAFYLVSPDEERAARIFERVRARLDANGLADSPLMIIRKTDN